MTNKRALIVGNLPGASDEANALLAKIGDGYTGVWDGTKGADGVRGVAEVIITANHAVARAEIDSWGEPKMISLAFTGYDHVDIAYCRKKKIYVYYVPDYSKASVAELVVLLTLASLRKLRQAHDNTRTGKFDREGVQPGAELEGMTIAIIGPGKIGTHTARKFLGLGCRVIGYKDEGRAKPEEFLKLGPLFAQLGSEYSNCVSYSNNLKQVLGEADVVSLNLATNEETRHFVNRDFLDKMQGSAVLINTARGGLVKTDDLVDALDDGRIAGAGIDVYDEEPVPRPDECKSEALKKLLAMDQVVLTPHLGFKTAASLNRLVEVTMRNVDRYVRRVSGIKDKDVFKNCLVPGGRGSEF